MSLDLRPRCVGVVGCRRVAHPCLGARQFGKHLLLNADLAEEGALVGDPDTRGEGAVRVTGAVNGRGFQELVGYARERKKREH